MYPQIRILPDMLPNDVLLIFIISTQRFQAHEYRWGERANLEVKKSSILRHVSKLYKREISSFTKQYEQVRLRQ